MRYHVIPLALLLLAAPLSAQIPAQVTIEPAQVEITNLIEDIALSLTITHEPDSGEVARQEEGLRLTRNLANFIAECGCINGGGGSSTISQFSTAGIVLALGFIGWQLKGIKEKPNGDDVHNEGDVKVQVNVPPHEKHDHRREKDRGES